MASWRFHGIVLALFVVASRYLVSSSSDKFLIRGIPLERAALYDPSKDFVCLDGTASVPFTYVNDDYCDCSDGSDEPGTAACPNNTFFCPNSGHVPQIVPSSRVNDGICDCCDTSDEWQAGSNCVNTCHSMGEAAREQYMKAIREQEAGFRSRQDLVAQANAKRNELETKGNELKALKEKAEQEAREKEAIKKEVEEREKVALSVYREREEAERARKAEEEKQKREAEMKAVWDVLDADKDGALTVAEIQVDARFDQNRDGQVSPEEARFFSLNQDSIGWDDFSRTGWVLMRPYVVGEAPMFTPPEPEEGDERPGEVVEEHTGTELPPPPPPATPEPGAETAGDPSREDYDDDEGPDNDNYKDEARQHEEEVQDDYEDIVTEPPTEVGEDHASDHGYDEETQLLVDEADRARKEYNEADRTLRDLEHELNSISATLEKDFGPEDAFLTLEGQCLEYTDREYLYKLCLFQQATQRPVHGGGETKLGSWKSWAGSQSNPYEKMMYENGLGCWNGPNRSAQVALSCGKENRITSVSEPSRCVYYFEVETPAVCTQPPSLPESEAHQQWHEEL